MTMGILASLAAGAGYGASKMMNKSSNRQASPTPLPQAPSPDAASVQAQKNVRKKRSEMTQSIFTNPLGVGGQADVTRAALKTKTGQ